MSSLITVLTTLFTFPGIIFTIIFLVLLFGYAFYVIKPRQYKALADYYQGSLALNDQVVGCHLSFTYGAHRYGMRRTAQGGMENSPMRMQTWLVAEVVSPDEFFVGHERTEEYFFRFNFGSGAVQKMLILDDKQYRIGSDSEQVSERIKRVLEESSELQSELKVLFAEPWAYMAIKKERHLGRGVVIKMEYIGFPFSVVKKPEDLKPYLEALERLLKAVGV